jgi:hypothetical protein
MANRWFSNLKSTFGDRFYAELFLQRRQKIHGLHDRQERRLVVFHIARDQAVHFILYRGNHLHRVFKITVTKIQRLFDRALVHGNNF